MDKQEFLEELGQYLAILDEKEQQDIKEEYAQHIDMKTENGLSEEEAIRDFGDIQELASEILEAYHVNPEYKRKSSILGTGKGKSAAEKGRSFLKRGKRLLLRAAEAGRRWIHVCFGQVKRGAGFVYGFLARPWKNVVQKWKNRGRDRAIVEPEKPVAEADSSRYDRPHEEGKRKQGGIIRSIGSFFGDCFRGVFFAFLWCIRWCFNSCMIILAFFSGLCTLGALFATGVSSVWLFHGYPFLGITIIGWGSILCGVSFTCLCFSLVRRQRGQQNKRSRDSMDVQNHEGQEENHG